MNKKKKDRDKSWCTIESFPLKPAAGVEEFPKLLWWFNSWAFVSWNSETKQWLTDDGLAPFESDEQPTEWASLPPPPLRAIIELLKSIDEKGESDD